MAKDNLKLSSKTLPGLKKNISLKKYTTFKIGGKAKYFLETGSEKNLIKGIKGAKAINLPFFVLGGGSNLLVSDKGYDGLIIKLRKTSCHTIKKSSKIYAKAGTPLALIVAEAAKNSLTGLEWAIGIPGTIGGAIKGNAGAFGTSISEATEKVEALDNDKINLVNIPQKECGFGYRQSIFKKKKGLIILSAVFQLKKGNKTKIKTKMDKFILYRKKTQPLKFPSSGSIFENLQFTTYNLQLLKKFPELKKFNKEGIIPAAFLIEKCGLKGKKAGEAQISEKHANFIINLGKGKAKDVAALINLIKSKVKNKFNITLKEEIEHLPS